MLFNSFEFAFFLPVVFAIYWLLGRNTRCQNFFLLAASYVFYGWWDWRFLVLMTISILSAWSCGVALGLCENRRTGKIIVAAALIVNFGILAVFKYFNFFAGNFEALLGALGFKADMPSIKVILPVGISFYTFQALGYVIDVYRKDIKPERDIVTFMAFISFFPQLVAGPIERAQNLLPQFNNARSFSYAVAVDGCRQMLWGFAKKIILADYLATVVDGIFANYEMYPGSTKLLGAVFFAFQIYGDFSGYSDIAIGCAKLFGFKLMRNFAYPYFSRDIGEFWRRWHISLTTWFRDYLYIPLGGSRCGTGKRIRNTFAVFLVSGLWHGANWTFIFWGFFHACLFLPLLLFRKKGRGASSAEVAEGKTLPSLNEAIRMLATFGLVTLGWIAFRAPDMATAVKYACGIFSPSLFSAPAYRFALWPKVAVVAIFVVAEWFRRDKPHVLVFRGNAVDGSLLSHCLRFCAYLAIAILCVANLSDHSDFIYFQF